MSPRIRSIRDAVHVDSRARRAARRAEAARTFIEARWGNPGALLRYQIAVWDVPKRVVAILETGCRADVMAHFQGGSLPPVELLRIPVQPSGDEKHHVFAAVWRVGTGKGAVQLFDDRGDPASLGTFDKVANAEEIWSWKEF